MISSLLQRMINYNFMTKVNKAYEDQLKVQLKIFYATKNI